MHDSTRVWVIGGLATATTIASTFFNAVIAFNITSTHRLLLSLRVLPFVAFGLSIAVSVLLAYFTALFIRQVDRHSLASKSAIWTTFVTGVCLSLSAATISGTIIVWLMALRDEFSKEIMHQPSLVMLTAWCGTWGASVLSQIALFIVLGLWTKRSLKTRSVGRLDLDFAIRLPPMDEAGMNDSNRSLNSRDTTLASPPRTPTSTQVGSSLRYSLSAKAGGTSSRTKLVGRHSARSSLDTVSHPVNETGPVDTAFDKWDTSLVHHEMRAAVGSSPPVTRSGLETIPGSRPDSPADALDGPFLSESAHVATLDDPVELQEPFLPSSPRAITSDNAIELEGPFLPSSPRATSSDTATVHDWSSPPRKQTVTSTPPSSPPNFSRPTSRGNPKPLSTSVETSLQELIHPLFRATSPHPPPIATMGTMVTASPMANDPITPKTLARLRSNSFQRQTPKSTGHWRAMPSVDATSTRPSTAGSRPGSSGLGSPGPSVIDEDELPPILPGFVLSAGSRSSLMGYSARKSLRKERRQSSLSNGP